MEPRVRVRNCACGISIPPSHGSPASSRVLFRVRPPAFHRIGARRDDLDLAGYHSRLYPVTMHGVGARVCVTPYRGRSRA